MNYTNFNIFWISRSIYVSDVSLTLRLIRKFRPMKHFHTTIVSHSLSLSWNLLYHPVIFNRSTDTEFRPKSITFAVNQSTSEIYRTRIRRSAVDI